MRRVRLASAMSAVLALCAGSSACVGEIEPIPAEPSPPRSAATDAGGVDAGNLPVPDAGDDAGLPEADAGTGAQDGGVDASTPDRWPVLSRPYLDGTVTSAGDAYAQDAWDETMVGASGGRQHPFFGTGSFGCTRSTVPSGTMLRCSAALSEPRTRSVGTIVLHNTLESLPDTVSIFHRNRPFFRTDRAYPVSIHYVIGRDGTIVDMVPESRVAYHSGTLAMNADSVGIELVANVASDATRGHLRARTWDRARQQAVLFSTEGLTVPQYRSLLWLLTELTTRYPQARILSHREVSSSTSCPGSIWRSAQVFTDWRARDLQPHLTCQKESGTLAAFALCLR